VGGGDMPIPCTHVTLAIVHLRFTSS